jgi:hypothetical protein
VAAILIRSPINAIVDHGQPGGASEELWRFDRIDRLGTHATQVAGHPRVIDTPLGKAVEFDGAGDALFVDVHPLAGAREFTWEAIFRPDGGAQAQRWFHLQENGSDDRMLFEIRVVDDRWYLDTYVHSGANEKALIDRERTYPLGRWYHVAAVYDGRVLRNYVDGVEQNAAEIALSPQREGRSSIGVRINRVDYFKGAIHAARFTRRARAVREFLSAVPRAR